MTHGFQASNSVFSPQLVVCEPPMYSATPPMVPWLDACHGIALHRTTSVYAWGTGNRGK